MGTMRLLILSLTSGFLSYLSVSLPRYLSSRYNVSDDALFFLPGVLFGLFILIPLVPKTPSRAIRWLALMIFSVAAWTIAVSIGFKVLPLVNQTSVISCGISGSAGVIILALASRYLIPAKFTSASVIMALAAGFFGGCIIGMAINQPRASLTGEVLYFTGFLFWHSSVAVTLFWKRPEENRIRQDHVTV
jgi:hypothetical protein